MAGNVQELAAHIEAITTVMAIERQSVYGNDGEHAAKRCGEEVVRRSDREGAVHTSQREAREQAHGIKVARVIADHDERPIEWEVFLADHFESIEGP